MAEANVERGMPLGELGEGDEARSTRREIG
jgi:hypothetical protein